MSSHSLQFRQRTRPAARAVAALLAVSIVTVACGSDDDADGTASTITVDATTATSLPPDASASPTAPTASAPSSASVGSAPEPHPAAWNPEVEPNVTAMSADDARAIDDAFTEVVETESGITGIWVGIWSADQGHYTAAYGNAEAGGAAATAQDHSRIGSVTKTFTATAILQHVDSGDLALDDTIADRLPDLAATYPDLAPLTVEQLVGMTSGIPDYANTGSTLQTIIDDPSKVWTPEEIIDLVMTTLPLEPAGTPGYSTTNYLILGEILEQLENTPIDEILTALAAANGMPDTALTAPDDNSLPDPSSHGYLDPNGVSELETMGISGLEPTDVTDWSASWGGAGGSMYSTIADLGTWAASGLGTANLSPDLAAERLETKNLPAEQIDYGLGIIDFGDGWIGHSGQIIGWESIVLYDTDTGDTAVLIVNATSSLTAALVPLITVFPELVTVFA